MAIPRKLRRELNEAVAGLEETDIHCFNPQKFEQEIRRVRLFLDSHGVLAESDYRKRLTRFEERIKQEVNHHIPAPENLAKTQIPNNTQAYAGVLGGEKIKVLFSKDFYTLRRPLLQPERILNWTFNSYGRLTSIEQNLAPVIQIVRNPKMPDFWREAEVTCYPISDYLFIALDFQARDLGAYDELIKFGHNYSRSILSHLKSNDIGEPNVYRNKEVNLRELVNNPEAMKMIRRAADIFPDLELRKSGKYFLRYEEMLSLD